MHYEIKIREHMVTAADQSERSVGWGEGTIGDAFRLFGFECDRAAETCNEGTWMRLLINGCAKIGYHPLTGAFTRYNA